jgi:hypothetical protein
MAITNRMPNGQVLRNLSLGLAVERATAALPATTQSALFNVVGGRIAVLGIIGEVTTVIQTQACNTKIRTNPTTGSDVDICANLDITGDEVGCLYGITGTFSDAMVGANAGATVLPDRPVVVPIGTIDMVTSATNTGSVKWAIFYEPIDDGAYVTAA